MAPYLARLGIDFAGRREPTRSEGAGIRARTRGIACRRRDRRAGSGSNPRGEAMKPILDLVAGARPTFMKIAPVALAAEGALDFHIVHTGQHYDEGMSEVFFRDLRIPAPDANLGVGSGSHGTQTARILERYEAHLLES